MIFQGFGGGLSEENVILSASPIRTMTVGTRIALVQLRTTDFYVSSSWAFTTGEDFHLALKKTC